MNRNLKFLGFILILWFLAFLAWEWWHSYPRIKTQTLLKKEGNEAKLDSVLLNSMSKYLLPGLVVIIVKDGKVYYEKTLGLQNVASRDSMTWNSLLPLASVSKLFTSLALANVAIQHDKQPSDLAFDNFYEGGEGVRLEQLLSHRSGLGNRNFFKKIFTIKDRTLHSEAGNKLLGEKQKPRKLEKEYADVNFDLLGYWMERQESQPFGEIVNERIFSPCGMPNTSFLSVWPVEESPMMGYHQTFLWKRLEENQIWFEISPSPSSSMATTSKDIRMAMIHLLRGEVGFFQKELEWLRQESEDIPLGFQQEELGGSNWIGHYGGQAGYSSFLFFNLPAKTGIFVFANFKDKVDFRKKIATDLIAVMNQTK